MTASSKVGQELGRRGRSAARAFHSCAQRLRSDCSGLTTVEYVIVLCLIAVVAVATWKNFGDAVNRYLKGATTSIETQMPDDVK